MSLVSVGVSGGVDSAATVLMLKNRGFNVKGVHFSVFSEKNSDYLERLSECLDIDIVDRDVSELFDRTIINPFVDGYLCGATPSPCVECNPTIKWRVVRGFGEQIGASYWATGHYARVVKHNGLFYVARGVDPLKDQSYYLWKLDQSTLKGAIMPLGDNLKVEVKKFMSHSGLDALSCQKESMGVCFLGRGGYKELLRGRVTDIDRLCDGEIIDRGGRVVGSHEGYPFYTIAQYKGLNLDKGLCVVEIDPKNNRLIVGDQNELYTDNFAVENYNFVSIDEAKYSANIEVKVRGIGRNPNGYCKIQIIDGSNLRVELLSDKAWAVAKGQPVVFYIDQRVVGGGYIR